MASLLSVAPVLSTPDTHILNEVPVVKLAQNEELSDEQLRIRYEIDRITAQIRKERWRRVALQFPDEMLPDSARVYQLLSRGLLTRKATAPNTLSPGKDVADQSGGEQLPEMASALQLEGHDLCVKLTILADTSYGSCCVDEIAAEHVGADAVVHYGRACLSPTARLPVVHVFTERRLDHSSVIASFKRTFPDLNTKVILTADVTYANHVDLIWAGLCRQGYTSVYATSVVHEPSSPLPNRTIPDSVRVHPSTLIEYTLFHISEPPTSLLLTLSSRVRSIHIYSTSPTSSSASPDSLLASTSSLLRRRYALVTSLSTVPIWGILINTLSVKNYLDIVEVVKKRIAGAGKKSYLLVVGKLNAAKLANFSEIGGWVVIGCWESSLVDSKDFYRPVVTPFELMLALQHDSERLWTGQWSGDFQAILDGADGAARLARDGVDAFQEDTINKDLSEEEEEEEEESAPPEFDLRTGKYVSQTRPLAAKDLFQQPQISNTASTALARRATGDIVSVNGVASPGAEHLRSKRTWQGLGSDFEIKYEEEEQGAAVEEGRSGIARGYTIGQSPQT